MPLSQTQIQDSLKTPAKKQVIDRAVKYQDRLRFHTVPTLERAGISRQVITEYMNWVKSLLQKEDKYAIFEVLCRFPVKTVKETDKIFDALSKVFDGQNPVFRYDFR